MGGVRAFLQSRLLHDDRDWVESNMTIDSNILYLQMMQQQQVHKSFLFGCVSGLSSTVLLQPLDVVKTRLQLRSGISSRLARYIGLGSLANRPDCVDGWCIICFCR